MQCAGCVSRVSLTLLAAAILGLPAGAGAQSLAVGPSASPAPAAQPPAAAEPGAATYAAAYAAAYEAALAALQAGQLQRARAMLLDIVRQSPQFAGAWLDLAIVTQALGDPIQAEEFLDLIERRFAVPAALQQAMLELRQRIRRADQLAAGPSAAAPDALATLNPPGAAAANPGAPALRLRAQAQVGGGYDANANAGLSATSISLTLPGGPISLPLADSFRPRGDAFSSAQLSTEATLRTPALQAWGITQAEWGAALRSLAFGREEAFSTQEAQTSAALNFAGPWRLSASAQHLRLGGLGFLTSVGAAVRKAWPTLACQPQAALEWDRRRFETSPNLNSRLVWLGLQGQCADAQGPHRTGWQLRLGHEAGLAPPTEASGGATSRPGTNTLHQEWAVARKWALPSLPAAWAATFPGSGATPPRLEAQAQWTLSRDTGAYSPLLSNNAARVVRRATLGVNLALPVGPGWVVNTALQGFQQSSNLQVFELSGRLLMLQLQKTW